MSDREKVINGLREMSCRATWKDIDRIRHKFQPIINDAIVMLKKQEQDVQNLIADLDDLQKEHEKLLDKKIPLITSGKEVIRCKDCKFRQSRVSRIIDGKECNLCEMVKGYKPAEWYCADGERKHENG